MTLLEQRAGLSGFKSQNCVLPILPGCCWPPTWGEKGSRSGEQGSYGCKYGHRWNDLLRLLQWTSLLFCFRDRVYKGIFRGMVGTG